MVDGPYIIVPLLPDGRAAIGPLAVAVGVRVRLMGTPYSETIVDPDRSITELIYSAQQKLSKWLPEAESLGFAARDVPGLIG